MTTLAIVSFFAGFATAVAVGYMIGKRNRIKRGPRKFLICGESGGSGRLNNDEVVDLCDPLAEREPPYNPDE